MMLDYKSITTDDLRQILANAAAELISRRHATGNENATQHDYRISMRRTSNREPHVFRFTMLEGTVVKLPLPLNEVIGKTGKVIGGEFLLNDGDVVQKIAASGQVSYLIPWQGNIDDRDYDVSVVFEGNTEEETVARIEAFVRDDRTLLIQELTGCINFWQNTLPEYEENGRTDKYWKRAADDCRARIARLELMLRWARSTNEEGICPGEHGSTCALAGRKLG
jgi:hypothetical protein